MDDRKNYLTAEKWRELEQELKYLHNTRRPEILSALEFAKSLGDLSENAEYHQAREEQRKLEERISQVTHLLRSSTIISKPGPEAVGVGSVVTVCKAGEENCRRYQIVDSEESNMKTGKISYHSPLGVALFNRRKGEIISFETPGGAANYEIKEIE